MSDKELKSKAQAEDTVNRDFLLIVLAAIIVLGVFILLALRVEVPDSILMIVVTIAASFFGSRVERIR